MHTVLTCFITRLKVLLKVLVLIIAILFTSIVNNPGYKRVINSFPTSVATGGELHSVDCRWLSKIDRPPWIGFALRDCTVRTGAETSATPTVVAIRAGYITLP